MSTTAVRQGMQEILSHIETYSKTLDLQTTEKILTELAQAQKIFVLGAGRSGLVGKAFAMRLMHLDLNVYVIGETVYPAIQENDVLFAISGSGETAGIVNAAKKAKEKKARIIALTSNTSSELAKNANLILEVKGRTKNTLQTQDYESKQIAGQHASLSPLGTLFEDTCQILLDGIIAGLMVKMGKNEQALKEKHANLE